MTRYKYLTPFTDHRPIYATHSKTPQCYHSFIPSRLGHDHQQALSVDTHKQVNQATLKQPTWLPKKGTPESIKFSPKPASSRVSSSARQDMSLSRQNTATKPRRRRRYGIFELWFQCWSGWRSLLDSDLATIELAFNPQPFTRWWRVIIQAIPRRLRYAIWYATII
jgi:hypothetical protein